MRHEPQLIDPWFGLIEISLQVVGLLQVLTLMMNEIGDTGLVRGAHFSDL